MTDRTSILLRRKIMAEILKIVTGEKKINIRPIYTEGVKYGFTVGIINGKRSIKSSS